MFNANHKKSQVLTKIVGYYGHLYFLFTVDRKKTAALYRTGSTVYDMRSHCLWEMSYRVLMLVCIFFIRSLKLRSILGM